MADADTAGTSSTPSTTASTAADPAAATSATTQPVTAAPAVAAATTTAEPAKEPAKADAKVEAPVDPAAFTLPEDLKFNPEAVTAFQAAIKGKVTDGKLNLSAQDVADLMAEQARSGLQRWEKQQVEQDRAYEAASKQRFTPAELAKAEAAIGFLTAKQLASAEKAGLKDVTPFRELAKGFKNHPDFVEVMRIVGDSLSEDTFERGGTPPPAKKTAGSVMYPNSKPS